MAQRELEKTNRQRKEKLFVEKPIRALNGPPIVNLVGLNSFAPLPTLAVDMQKEIKNAQGEKIDFTYHDGQKGTQDIVVIGHGVTGNKDRPFIVALADG